MLDILTGTPVWVVVAMVAVFAVAHLEQTHRANKLRSTVPPRLLPDGSDNPEWVAREDHWKQVLAEAHRIENPNRSIY